MTAAPTFKSKIERYTVGDVVVELVKMPPDLRREYHGNPGPVVRSQWEVRVGGELRGYIIYPLGVGNPWQAYSLVPNILRRDGFEFGRDTDLVRVWQDAPNGELPGTWDKWSGRFAHLQEIYHPELAVNYRARPWASRAEIALAWPALMAAGKAPLPATIEKMIKASYAAEAEKKAKKIADDARYARERAERDAAEARRVQAAEDYRVETLEGLESLREKLSAQMSNLELLALGRAIQKFGGAA